VSYTYLCLCLICIGCCVVHVSVSDMYETQACLSFIAYRLVVKILSLGFLAISLTTRVIFFFSYIAFRINIIYTAICFIIYTNPLKFMQSIVKIDIPQPPWIRVFVSPNKLSNIIRYTIYLLF